MSRLPHVLRHASKEWKRGLSVLPIIQWKVSGTRRELYVKIGCGGEEKDRITVVFFLTTTRNSRASFNPIASDIKRKAIIIMEIED